MVAGRIHSFLGERGYLCLCSVCVYDVHFDPVEQEFLVELLRPLLALDEQEDGGLQGLHGDGGSRSGSDWDWLDFFITFR